MYNINANIPMCSLPSILVRGHCIYWGVHWFVPNWLRLMSAEGVQAEMQRRMDYLLKRYEDE